MTTNERIKLSKKKFKTKNNVDESLDLLDYSLECYNNCTPQSYGSKIEKKVKMLYNFKKIKKKLGQGDLKVCEKTILDKFPFLKENDRLEFKVSFLSGEKNQLSYNFIQIRPHEEFEYYLFMAIDLDYSDEDVNVEWYVVKKNDINDNNFKLNIIHGNKKNTENNQNVEYKLHVTKNSEQHQKLKELNLL
jgi:hypothetical protein